MSAYYGMPRIHHHIKDNRTVDSAKASDCCSQQRSLIHL